MSSPGNILYGDAGKLEMNTPELSSRQQYLLRLLADYGPSGYDIFEQHFSQEQIGRILKPIIRLRYIQSCTRVQKWVQEEIPGYEATSDGEAALSHYREDEEWGYYGDRKYPE